MTIIDQDEEYWDAQREYENRHKEKLKEYRKTDKGKDAYKKSVKKYYEANKEKNKVRIRKWQKENKDKINKYMRKVQLKKKYGITPEQYDELFIEQKGCCKICGKHQTEFKNRLSVDHDHVTGKIRGLLCNSCNQILGHAHDNPEILQKAILYLEQYSQK